MNYEWTEENSEDSWRLRRDRDLRVRLLQLYLLFVGSVLIVSFLFDALASDRLEHDVKDADLALAQAIGQEIDDLVQSGAFDTDYLTGWLHVIAVDRDGLILIVDSDENLVARQGRLLPDESLWIGWQNRTIRNARNRQPGWFVTTAPDDQVWLHSHVTTPQTGWKVIVQRPFPSALAAIEGFHHVLLIAVGVYLLGGVVFWMVLSYELITPLERLEAFSGLVRWRGRIRPAEQSHLSRLADRMDQVGSLSRSLLAMAKDIEDRFVQLATLLETSRVVASSLDLTTVMDNILEQVQRLFQVDRCAIVALDQRVGVFRIRASRGLTEDYVNSLRIAPTQPNSPSMRALRNQRPIQVSDTEKDLAFVEFRPRARQEGYRSVLAIPLLVQLAPPAVLLLYKSSSYRYSYTELELAISFANHATIAMENAALHALTDEQLQEQTRRLEAIVESLDDGLILASTDGEVLYCNQRSCEWLGLSRGQIRRKPTADLLDALLQTAVDPSALASVSQAARNDQSSLTFDFARRDQDGEDQDLRIHLFDVTDAQGQRIGRGQLWQDITHDKELDRMKSSLLSTVSHELRTPLAAIKGYASTLLAEDVEWDAVAQREFLQTISVETDRLTRLVKDLLDMSRLEAGTLPLRCQHHPLSQLVSHALQQVNLEGDSRLRLQLPSDLPLVWADASHIETVIRNLVENAVKYSPADAPIELKALQENGHLIVQVRDYGEGVPTELRSKIFDRFFRADDRFTRSTGGVGMGLAICKGFVEAHGGRVWVADGEPGAVFAFSLPVKHEFS